MMRAGLLAGAFLVVPLVAHAGGVNLPGSIGYGAAPAPYGGPTKAQPICAALGASCPFGAGPANGDLLIDMATQEGGGASNPAVVAGWTLVYHRTFGVSNIHGMALACKWAGASEPATQTAFGSASANTAFDIQGPIGGTCASHIAAGPNTSASGSTGALGVSVSVSGSALVVATAGFVSSTTGSITVTALTGLEADTVLSPGSSPGAGGASGGETGRLSNTGAGITATFSCSGSCSVDGSHLEAESVTP
jgi:hypothetical protein